jgi:hypothetical protein
MSQRVPSHCRRYTVPNKCKFVNTNFPCCDPDITNLCRCRWRPPCKSCACSFSSAWCPAPPPLHFTVSQPGPAIPSKSSDCKDTLKHLNPAHGDWAEPLFLPSVLLEHWTFPEPIGPRRAAVPAPLPASRPQATLAVSGPGPESRLAAYAGRGYGNHVLADGMF